MTDDLARKSSLQRACVVLSIFCLGCVKAEVSKPSYELCETGTLTIRNDSPLPMAIGGCNPSRLEERLPGRWVGDPFLHPLCTFFTGPDGRHTLTHYELVPPGGSLDLEIPTGWVSSTPAIIRMHQRVSTACEPPDFDGAPLTCHRVEHVVTDPIVIFEPGTSETTGRRPLELFADEFLCAEP